MTAMGLDNVRQKIDQIDYEIVKLLEARFELGAVTKKLKKDVADPAREKEVLANVTRYPGSLIEPGFARKLFTQVMDESKRVQKEDKALLAFQGEHGAYGEMACRQYITDGLVIPCIDFAEVFSAVERGECDYGVVPVENTLGGLVAEVNDLLVDTKLHAVGEVRLPIHHSLLVPPGTDYREIKAVYSHPQALAQCRGFIERNKLDANPVYDTAGAARMVAAERPKASAAIASRLCAELYNLEVLKENIEDAPANTTRFLVLARNAEKGGDKGSLIFSTPDKAGALFSILKIFSDANVNLTRIESRPSRHEAGRFVFMLDIMGKPEDPAIVAALEKVKKATAMFKVLGFYKQAK